jgi:hypothetical protein
VNGFPKRLSPRPFGSPARRSRITLASTSPPNKAAASASVIVFDENIVDGQGTQRLEAVD